MTSLTNTVEQIWSWLGKIPDPEIPVISITDLGIVRDVSLDNDACTITLTPTYSGCPATEAIATQIRDAFAAHGLTNVHLRTQLSPAWTTDWLSDNGRQRLREYGIAPPSSSAQNLTQITPASQSCPIPCPHCGSARTALMSHYGSTPCKALYRCLECREPFDYFKPH